MTPVWSAPDGVHRVVLRLTPAGLGTVDATVEVRAGRVSVELTADTLAAHQLLASSLPQLRDQLGTAGQPATVHLTTRDETQTQAHAQGQNSQNSPTHQGEPRRPREPAPVRSPDDPAGQPSQHTVRSSTPSSIDIRL